MKKKYLVFITLVLTFVIGCKENKKAEVSSETSQMTEVMAIHDEVMPKMGKIGRLVADLRKKIDNDQGTAADKKAMEDLQEANKSMMDWMKNFGDTFSPEEIMDGKELSPEKQALLDMEEKSVKVVKEKMNTSIAKAEELLGKN